MTKCINVTIVHISDDMLIFFIHSVVSKFSEKERVSGCVINVYHSTLPPKPNTIADCTNKVIVVILTLWYSQRGHMSAMNTGE